MINMEYMNLYKLSNKVNRNEKNKMVYILCDA